MFLETNTKTGGDVMSPRYDIVKTVRVGRDSLRGEMREIRETTGSIIHIADRRLFHAMRNTIMEAGRIFEVLAEYEAPKNTTQLSKTIGHYRVDPDTQYDALLEYGYVEDPSVSIWEEKRSTNPENNLREVSLFVGTGVSYAQKQNQKTHFMENAAVRLAAGMPAIMRSMLYKAHAVRQRRARRR
jgi:hypothetical protein